MDRPIVDPVPGAATPLAPTPWRVDGFWKRAVVDANGQELFRVNTKLGTADDDENLAAEIVRRINESVGVI